jgi:hypothetical protein
MKTKKCDSAFPISGYCADASGALCGEVIHHEGMSLRDYFAGKVLPSIILDDLDRDNGESYMQAVVRLAYEYADAMLEERKK